MQTTTSATKKGIDFILNTKKGYPDWIKNHPLFKELPGIEKVFPRIGLPNFKEPCEIMNTEEAQQFAIKFGAKLIAEINARIPTLYQKLDPLLASTDKERDSKCAKLQTVINLCNSVAWSMANFAKNGVGEYITVVEGKIELKLRSDIFAENKAVFKKGEAILRVFNKLKDMCAEYDVIFSQYDQWQEFKDFSRTNVGARKYHVVFSSTGEEGVWDIATISMRGITSCQNWTSPQSRALIGSITSKYVAVMYLASDQDTPGYGKKMLHRCMIRFVINSKNKRPMLVMDKMYPSENKNTVEAFKRALNKRSGLDVLYAPEKTNEVSMTYIPQDTFHSMWKQGEYTYMDHKIAFQQHPTAISVKKAADLSAVATKLKNKIGDELSKIILTRREQYAIAMKEITERKAEYIAEKTKWEEANKNITTENQSKFELTDPTMDAALTKFFRGGVENLFNHFDKKHGKNSAGHIISNIILNVVPLPNESECATTAEYQRKFIMNFLRDPNKIKEIAYKKYTEGADQKIYDKCSWMKSYPKSSDKLFNTMFAQIKENMRASIKEIFKTTN